MLVLCCFVGGGLAPSAEATWGGHCSMGEGHHCYADGGAWSSWATGVKYYYNSGICAEQNSEFPTVEGDIMWGTQGYDECLHAEP